MVNFYEKSSYIDLINTTCDVVMYYSTIEEDFIPLEDGEEIPEDYVEVPFAGEIEECAMQNFWAELGRSEIDRPYHSRFRSHIRKLGLEEAFDQYEADLVLPYMKAWAAANDIDLDWDSYIVI